MAMMCEYRYGFNGAEKESEITGNSGDVYDLGLRFYDSRIGRMFSIDPRSPEYPWQTTYSYHKSSPIWMIDYKGAGGPGDFFEELYNAIASDVKSDVKNIDKVPEMIADDIKKDATAVAENTKELAENISEASVDAFDKAKEVLKNINPVEDIEVYGGAYIKTETPTLKGVKLTVAMYGKQIHVSTKSELSIKSILPDDSYLNLKVGKADFRFYGLNNSNEGVGDYEPGLRMLYTISEKPLIKQVPLIFEKTQLDAHYNIRTNTTKLGQRHVIETVSFPTFNKGAGIKAELNFGYRLELKVPNYFK